MDNRKDLYREEKLATAVRNFRCLYDKSDKSYKDRIVRQNAWTEVAREMGFSSDAEAEAHWVNLRTRFTRQRKTARALGKMDRPSNEEHEAHRNLDVFHMLSWLDEFVLCRKRLSNMDRQGAKVADIKRDDMDEECDVISQVNDNRNHYAEHMEEAPGEESATQVIVSSHLVGNASVVEGAEPITAAANHDVSYRERNSNVSPVQRDRIDLQEKINAMSRIKTPLNSFKPRKPIGQETKDENDIFGELIASQLKKLSEHYRLQAKHQINNIMFQVQMQQLNASSQCSPPLNIIGRPHHLEDSGENCPCNRDVPYQNTAPCYGTTAHYVRVLDDQPQEYSTAKDASSPTSNHSPTQGGMDYRQGYLYKGQKKDT